MAIHSFLKAEKGDPDWQYSPETYIGKEFKLIDASTVELAEKQANMMVLRQNPTEKELLAKHIKISVKPESKLDLIIINEADNKLQQVFLYDVVVEEGSAINFGIFVKGGKLNKHIVQVYLEEGAEFNAYGLAMNTVGGDTEIITKTVHQNCETSSNQIILGIAGKDSQTVYQAMSVLDTASEGSEAHLEGANLVIGEGGRCFSRPEVYVNCDGTESSQASNTSYLNYDKLYYLQSRGIDIKKAARLVIEGFQSQTVDIVAYDDIREEITQLFEI